MGFTKKSLLAMVLALVMVIGMAVPTAFAADSEQSNNLTFSALAGSNATSSIGNIATVAAAPVGVAQKYALVFAHDTSSATLPLTEDALGAKVKYELWADNALSASITDGVLTVMPQDVGSRSVKVRVSQPDSEAWPGIQALNAGWTKSYFWEGTITFAAVPTATYKHEGIVLDAGDQAKKIATISATDFSTAPSTTNVEIASVTLKNSSGIAAPSPIVTGVGGSWSITALSAGDDILVVELVINGYKAGNPQKGILVDVPLHIGNANNEDYALATNVPTTGIVVERNQAAGLNFTLSVKDKAGNPTRPVGDKRLANYVKTVQPGGLTNNNNVSGYVFTLVPDTTVATDYQTVNTLSGTNGIIFAKDDLFDRNGLVRIDVPSNLISFKGRVDVTYIPAQNNPTHGAVLYTSFPLVIKPAPLTVSPSPVIIDLAKNDQGAIKNNTGVLTLSSTGKLVPQARVSTYGTTFTFPANWPANLGLDVYNANSPLPAIDQTLGNGFVAGTNYQFRFAVTGSITLGTYEATVQSAVTPSGETSTYYTETKTFKIQVVDTTPNPVFTSKSTAIDSDLNGITNVDYEITNMLFAPPTNHVFSLTGTFSAGGAAPSFAFVDSPIPQTGKGTFKVTAGSAPYNGTLTISGTVDGVKIADVKIPVTVAERAVGKPHHFVATPNPISTKLGTPTTFTIAVYDYQNTLIANKVPSIIPTSDSTAVFANPTNDLGGAAGTTTTNTWKISGLTAGTGKLTITGDSAFTGVNGVGTIDCSKAMPLVIPVTIEGIKMTANKTSLDYDLATPVADRKVTVQFAVDATTGINWDGIKVETTPGGWITPISQTVHKKGDGLYELVLSNTAFVTTSPVSAKISGVTVNGYAVDPLTIPVTVTNSAKLIADKTELALTPDVDGKKEGYVQISAQPAHSQTNILAVTSAVSSNPAVATIELVTGVGGAGAGYSPAFASYKVKAVAQGEALLTFQGTSNGNALQPVSVKVVVGEATKPVIVATPSGAINLSVKENGKKTETLTFSSTSGTLEGLTVVPADTSIATVAAVGSSWVVTAVKEGTTSLTVNAKIGAVTCQTLTIPVYVDTTAPVTGDFLLDGVAANGTLLQFRNSVANNQRKLTLNGATGAVTWKSSNKAIAKFINAPAGKATHTVTGTAEQWIQVLKTGTVTITATPANGTAKSITFTIKNEPETGVTVPGVTAGGTLKLLVNQRFSAKAQAQTATAKTKGYTYKSSAKSIATVSKKGIIVAKKAGKATITVNPKKKGIPNFVFEVEVTVDYSTLNFNSVVLMQDVSTGVANPNAAAVKTIFDSAKFTAAAVPTAANVLPSNATKAQVRAAITGLANAAKNTYDISNFYYAGAATKTGLTLSDGEYKYSELALDLSAITGNIVVYLDCSGSSRMINTKAATDADIFTAFSKAVTAGLKGAATADRYSFTVFTATQKGKTTITPDTTGVTTFTKKFVEAMSNTANGVAAANADKYVTVKSLWAKLKSAKGSVWASSKSVMPIYGAVPAAAANP